MKSNHVEPTTQQLSDHLYAIDTPYDGVYVRTYVVVGTKAALIDTGLNTTGRAVLDLLEALGSPKTVAAIHTHGHWDHIGSAATLRDATGCPIAAHANDVQMISSHAVNDERFLCAFPEFPPSPTDRRAVHDRLGPEVEIDLNLSGGEVFDLGEGVALEVVAIPGHTPGSIGAVERSSNAFFSGDGLAWRGVGGTLAQYEDVAAYRESIRRVMSMNVSHMHSGHFEPVVGPRVGRFLEECLDEVDSIEAAVRDAASYETDLVDVARETCRTMDKSFTLQAVLTTSAHMSDLGYR